MSEDGVKPNNRSPNLFHIDVSTNRLLSPQLTIMPLLVALRCHVLLIDSIRIRIKFYFTWRWVLSQLKPFVLHINSIPKLTDLGRNKDICLTAHGCATSQLQTCHPVSSRSSKLPHHGFRYARAELYWYAVDVLPLRDRYRHSVTLRLNRFWCRSVTILVLFSFPNNEMINNMHSEARGLAAITRLPNDFLTIGCNWLSIYWACSSSTNRIKWQCMVEIHKISNTCYSWELHTAIHSVVLYDFALTWNILEWAMRMLRRDISYLGSQRDIFVRMKVRQYLHVLVPFYLYT